MYVLCSRFTTLRYFFLFSELKEQELDGNLSLVCEKLFPTEGHRNVHAVLHPCFPQTLEEIAEMEEDIRRLEEDLRKKVWNLKLAHTRLETRTYRPNMELCRDQVSQTLKGGIGMLGMFHIFFFGD